jgi:hypothetical protein
MVKFVEEVPLVKVVFPRVERPVTVSVAEFVVLAFVVVAFRVVMLAPLVRRRVPSNVKAVEVAKVFAAVVYKMVFAPPNAI